MAHAWMLNHVPLILKTPLGKTIWLCSDCLAKEYTSHPQAITVDLRHTCKECVRTKLCCEFERQRLVRRIPRKRPIPLEKRLNIIRRRVA